MQRVLNNYDELRKILHDAGRIMFVHGRSAENFERLSECLSSSGAEVFHFTSYTPNPKIEEAESANQYFMLNKCVFLLTGGGGVSC